MKSSHFEHRTMQRKKNHSHGQRLVVESRGSSKKNNHSDSLSDHNEGEEEENSHDSDHNSDDNNINNDDSSDVPKTSQGKERAYVWSQLLYLFCNLTLFIFSYLIMGYFLSYSEAECPVV